MYALFIHDDAKADLLALWEREPRTAGRILALLEQLEVDPDLLDCLTVHDYGAHSSEDFHVSKWLEQWRKGRDLWRLKIWDLEEQGIRYRIVYAFVPVKRQYQVLAITPRKEFNYDESDTISQRILRAYEEL